MDMFFLVVKICKKITIPNRKANKNNSILITEKE